MRTVESNRQYARVRLLLTPSYPSDRGGEISNLFHEMKKKAENKIDINGSLSVRAHPLDMCFKKLAYSNAVK